MEKDTNAPIYRVFLCSTGDDLAEYREKAREVIESEDRLKVVRFETWGAMNAGATEASLERLDDSVLFVGIFAKRYGYVEDGFDRSVTEMEYDHALAKEMDRLCFCVDPETFWPDEKVEFETHEEWNALLKKVKDDRVVEFFDHDVEKFGNALTKAILKWLSKRAESGGTDSAGTTERNPRLHQLKPLESDFTGRTEAIQELLGPLSEGLKPIGVIRGGPGVGKSTLARYVAHNLKDQYPDAQLEYDLKGVDPSPATANDIMAKIIRAFDPEAEVPEDFEELAGLYQGTLEGKQALLFFDNAANDKSQVEPLIPPSGNMVLITSRYRFQLPGQKAIDLHEFTGDEAEAFLIRLDEGLGDHARELAALCGNWPLALRLVAGAIDNRPDRTVTDYLQLLKDAKERLSELKPVEVCIELSYNLLTSETKNHFAALAVFSDNFGKEAAAAVWGIPSQEADSVIGDLLSWSLLDWDSNTQHYKFHDLIRLYADKSLGENQREQAEENHARYYSKRLKRLDEKFYSGGDQLRQALEEFDLEWSEIAKAFQWVQSKGTEHERAPEIGSDLAQYGFQLLGLRLSNASEATVIGLGLKMAQAWGNEAAIAIHMRRFGFHQIDHQPDRAMAMFQKSLEISRKQGDREGEGISLGYLGLVHIKKGETERAIQLVEESLEVFSDPPVGADLKRFRRSQGIAHGRLGDFHLRKEAWVEAKQRFLEAISIEREIDDDPGLAIDLSKLAHACEKNDELAEAVQAREESLTIYRKLGNQGREIQQLANLGENWNRMLEPVEALDHFEQALLAPDSTINPENKVLLFLNFLNHSNQVSEPPGPHPRFARIITVADEIVDTERRAKIQYQLGNRFLALKYWEQALQCFDSCTKNARSTEDHRLEGNALGNQGCIHTETGNFEAAVDCHQRALVIDGKLGDQAGEAQGRWDLGETYEKMGEPRKALEQMEKSLSLRKDSSDEQLAKVKEIRKLSSG